VSAKEAVRGDYFCLRSPCNEFNTSSAHARVGITRGGGCNQIANKCDNDFIKSAATRAYVIFRPNYCKKRARVQQNHIFLTHTQLSYFLCVLA
jgi:hypothetical protein